MNHKTYAQTLLDIEQLKQEAEKIRTSELDATIEGVKKSISIYGITPSDVFSNEDLGYIQPNVVTDDTPTSNVSNVMSHGSINPPKYTNGKSVTWTGNGRKPQWFLDAVISGVAPEMMLISEKMTPPSIDSGDSKKPIRRIKGPGEKKYTNGIDQTWTGNGRKPKWFLDSVASGAAPETMLILRNLNPTVTHDSDKIVKKSKITGAPKYTDGMKATWTGNGRQPKWFKKALVSGLNRTEMLIHKISNEKSDENINGISYQEAPKPPVQKNYLSAVPIRFNNGKWRIFSGGGLKIRRLTKALQTEENIPSSHSKDASTDPFYNRKSQMEKLKEFIEKLSNQSLDLDTGIDKENKPPRKKGPGYRLGDHSWTGVGPRPKWLKEAIESGKILEELRET